MQINQLSRSIKFISIAFLFLLCSECFSYDDTLAVIGSRIVTVEDFSEQYGEKLREIGLTDNGETRVQYLQNLIGDELLIEHARKSRLHKTKAAQDEYNRIIAQELLNSWSDKYISSVIKITDEDLKDLYVKLNTKIQVRHLYAGTRQQADSIYKLLMNGSEFNDLASVLFKDPVLKNNGGLLGYISIDEMDPEFEKAAFALNIGEISKPVKTVKGYSIIKVEDIKRNPLLTENEFLKAYNRLKTFARKRKYEELTKNYVSGLASELRIEFNEKLLDEIATLINTKSSKNLFESRPITKDDLNIIVLNSSAGNWSLMALINEMSTVPEKQRKWIKSKENLKDFITGLVNRKYIINKALNERLDTSKAFHKKVNYQFDTYLLTSIEDQLKEKIKISPDSVKAYYYKNIHLFKSRPEIRLSSILLEDSAITVSVKKMLEENIPFEELARKYSVQTITAEKGGDIGYYKKDDLEYLGDELFSLKPGEWKGPFNDNDKYVFLKCTDLRPSVLTPFEECSAEIESTLKTFKWYEVRERYIESLKNDIQIEMFTSKLNSLNIR